MKPGALSNTESGNGMCVFDSISLSSSVLANIRSCSNVIGCFSVPANVGLSDFSDLSAELKPAPFCPDSGYFFSRGVPLLSPDRIAVSISASGNPDGTAHCLTRHKISSSDSDWPESSTIDLT